MALKKCKECGHEISTKAKVCPNCGEPQSANMEAGRSFISRILGLIGAILLFIGVLLPVVRFPMGSDSLMSFKRSDAIVMMGLAFLSLLLVLARSYKLLILPGCFSFGMVIYTYLRLQRRISGIHEEIKSGLDQRLQGNPFGALANSIAERSLQIQWIGFSFMIIGAILIITAGLTCPAKKDKPDSKFERNLIEQDSSN